MLSNRVRFIALVFFMMISVSLSAQNSDSYLVFSNDQVDAGGTVQVPVTMVGANSICAFQFSLVLPDGIEPAEDATGYGVVTGGNIFYDHSISYNYENGILHVACLSLTNSVFSTYHGVACYVNLKADKQLQTTEKEIQVTDIELCTPQSRSIKSNNKQFIVNVLQQEQVPEEEPQQEQVTEKEPEFSISVGPFSFSGMFRSSIAIESSVDLQSISFQLTIPEILATNRMVGIFGSLMADKYRTLISQVGTSTYRLEISAIDNGFIPAGKVDISEVTVTYVMGQMPPGEYAFLIDGLTVCAVDGKTYQIDAMSFKLNVVPSGVQPIDDNEKTDLYSIDGRKIYSPVNGVMLMRHPDGRVTKFVDNKK